MAMNPKLQNSTTNAKEEEEAVTRDIIIYQTEKNTRPRRKRRKR
jgi:hypothetical protein